MLAIPILYEDDALLIVNKPSGVAMHDSNTASNQGIVTLLKQQSGLRQLHLCHRLDTGTSGCLCLAKDARTAALVGEAFSSRTVSKFYLALSADKPKKKQGSIIGDMKNRRAGQFMLLKETHNPAVTQFFSYSAKPGIRGFIVKPYTGKTHQIRVALKSVGAAILGDTLYGGKPANRLHLHAWSLTLPLPHNPVSVTAPVSDGEYFVDEAVASWVSNLPEPTLLPWPSVAPHLLIR